jgi:hypothetical protein
METPADIQAAACKLAVPGRDLAESESALSIEKDDAYINTYCSNYSTRETHS